MMTSYEYRKLNTIAAEAAIEIALKEREIMFDGFIRLEHRTIGKP